MLPVVTPEEMAAIDRAAPEPVDVLIGRAGAAVARAALSMLGGAYGRRVIVVAGKGNNGNDGRSAADRLRRRGVRVHVVEAADADGSTLPQCDLVVDAAYGTGFRGEYQAPDPGDAPVLAVDIPSGVDGLTGAAGPGAVQADATVTFAALKPGLLFFPGRDHAGTVSIADIGLDCSATRTHVVEAADVGAWLPTRPSETHKWRAAVWIVAGSPGMTGAAALAAGGAQRSGAGYVRLSTPGAEPRTEPPIEVVRTALNGEWADDVLSGLERFKALVIGPGLGTSATSIAEVRRVVAGSKVPAVVDGDGLTALGAEVSRLARPGVVLTPHDGEYERLTGRPPGADRVAAARELAAACGAVVVLKGATPVVAGADGQVRVVTTNDSRLATAGTGDVLSGIIGGLLAQGTEPFAAAAAGAWLHGRAASFGRRHGFVAGDLLDLVADAFADVDRVRDSERRA